MIINNFAHSAVNIMVSQIIIFLIQNFYFLTISVILLINFFILYIIIFSFSINFNYIVAINRSNLQNYVNSLILVMH